MARPLQWSWVVICEWRLEHNRTVTLLQALEDHAASPRVQGGPCACAGAVSVFGWGLRLDKEQPRLLLLWHFSNWLRSFILNFNHKWWHEEKAKKKMISLVGFSWGAGSSAYQTEGAWDKDGKGLSIWDVFSHKKGKVQHNGTGDTACEGYYKVKVRRTRSEVIWVSRRTEVQKKPKAFHPVLCVQQDDVSLMKELKLNHYRFSISWPRILPTGIKCELLVMQRR